MALQLCVNMQDGWMLPAHYLEPIISVFHCLKLDNWRTVVVVVNLRMFLASRLYKEQFYIWFLGVIAIVQVIW